jgi:uncharacterized protein
LRLTFRPFFVMDHLKQFEIPVQSLRNGLHDYSFELDDTFFENFEKSPVKKGKYQVKLQLDKRENEFLLIFDIDGYFESPCDRCLADIDVPSAIKKLIWVKYSEDKAGQDYDDKIIYISGSEHSFQMAPLIYELVVLSMPLVRAYDCENDPNPKCDFKVLSFMTGNDEKESEEDNNTTLGDQLRELK